MSLHSTVHLARQTINGLVLAIGAGCGGYDGPPRVAVEGDVTFGGTPLRSGSIVFVPTEGTQGPEAGAQIKEGTFRLPQHEGPVIGRLRVEIRAERSWGYDPTEPEQTVQHIGEPLPPNIIPGLYNDQSDLVVQTTAEGENRFDFQLLSNP